MEEELVDYYEEGEEVLLKSIFSSIDKLLEIWKGSRADSK
jgi:hypothetical protein